MTRWLFCLSLVGCLTARVVRADAPLQVARADERMRVDGALREWKGARFVTLGQGEGSLRYALATRDAGLYVAAEVRDPRVIRNRSVGPGQDALVLTLAMPTRGGGWAGTDVWLHPGVVGVSKAAAAVGAAGGKRPKPARRVQVVEGPNSGKPGYVIEAFIPWQAVREADLWQMGRGALRYENADAKGRGRVSAQTAQVQPRRLASLPPLAMGQGQLDLVRAFLKKQNLPGVDPRFDLKGDVQGDRRAERVTVADRFVVVTGPGVHDGESYGYMELPLGLGGGVQDARLVDLTGDGKVELVVTLRQKNQLGSRRVWTVVDLDGGNPRRVFGVELEKRVSGGSLEAHLSLGKPRRGKPRPIVVRRGNARGLNADSYRESPARDVQPILLPWGPVERRVFQFRDGAFAMVDEKRDPEQETANGSSVGDEDRAPKPAQAAPAPPSMKALVDAAKAQAGIPAQQTADHHFRVNVAGGKKQEHVYVFGARLIAVGPDIGAGQRFFSYGLPVPQPEDLREVRCADVTGDGRAELLLRVRQSLNGDGVQREVLLVQRFTKQGFSRALAVEVSRSQGTKRIDNAVRTAGGSLRIGAGKARGWSAGNYPFPDEPVGGVGRLLLPWKDRAVAYRLVRGELRP